MLFNSLDFAIFLPTIFILYWFFTNHNLKHQNLLIVAASYFFYGWWDWRFLSLIIFSTLVDYLVGLGLRNAKSTPKRKILLWISILANLGLLGFFKYFNFFIDNINTAFTFFGSPINLSSLNLVLPVGISFYTFQTLSYTIDVYKNKIKATNDPIVFAAYVSFFPQLVAGPIERAISLLPQFKKKRLFEYSKAVDGLKQILWGLFKKVVIADNVAVYVNQIFSNSEIYSGSTLLVGALFFTFQIYCDFSGYSDIAIGTARLFGFDLMKNFAFPYFSRDIAEFWRRWHISLSTWFRDYVYIPLGGSRGSSWMKIRNIFIIFLVSGFWHGANWTFIVWGGLNALYFLPLMLLGRNRSNTDTVAAGKIIPSFREILNMTITFGLTVLAWIFFRAKDLGHAWNYLNTIFSTSFFTVPQIAPKKLIILLMIFVAIEWWGREEEYAIARVGSNQKKYVRWAFYYLIVLVIYFFGNFSKNLEFIYFQF